MNRPCQLPLVFVAVLVVARLATAQTAKDCGNLPGTSTTRDLDQCYHRIYQQTDVTLHTMYRQLSDKLTDPSERGLLQEAEQAWVQYRDKSCAFETAGTGWH